jgi:hypothetical protein
MKPLDALREFFRPKEITVALPDSQFVALDRDRTIEKLKLDDRGKESGSEELLSGDADEFDGAEAEIVAEIGDQLNRAQIVANENVKVYGQRLSELALLRELSSVTGASETAFGDFKSAVTRWRNRLANAADAIRDSYQELAGFKSEYRLQRPAHDVPPPIYTWSTIGISAIVESVGNTAFLSENNPYGIIGGFFIAAVIAAVNIGVSATIGRKVWPYLFHRDRWRNLLAWAGCTFWVLETVTWNLLAAHFRDASALGLDKPEVQAITLLWNAPLRLASMYSYGLLLLGFVFSLVAATAGFKMDDPYPGYGPIYRRHEDRCDEYAAEVEQALDELKDIRDTHIGSLQSVRDELRMQFAQRGQIVEARNALASRFSAHQDYLENFANSLLDHYRAANRKARASPAPARVRKKWRLPRSPLPPFPSLPAIESEVQAAQAALAHSIETISRAYNEAIESFASLEHIKGSLEHDQP